MSDVKKIEEQIEYRLIMQPPPFVFGTCTVRQKVEASRPAALVKLWLTQPSVFRARVTSEYVLTCGGSLMFNTFNTFNIEAPAHLSDFIHSEIRYTVEARRVPLRASTRPRP
jgi:hypothetical protein